MGICINFCDILLNYKEKDEFNDLLLRLSENNGEKTVERVYVGSYFCSNYFIEAIRLCRLFLFEYCRMEEIAVTVVIPIINERNLKYCKDELKRCTENAGDIIDEYVVNDYGSMNYIAKTYDDKKIILGRLFMKQNRDPRRLDLIRNMGIMNSVVMQELVTQIPQIYAAETDPTGDIMDAVNIPDNLKLHIHTPYCYMTYGNICEISSVQKNIEKKFRPGIACNNECSMIITEYEKDNVFFTKLGKTVYFYNDSLKCYDREFDRYIFFPLEEVKQSYEYSDSNK